jgi:hypothetical protein
MNVLSLATIRQDLIDYVDRKNTIAAIQICYLTRLQNIPGLRCYAVRQHGIEDRRARR